MTAGLKSWAALGALLLVAASLAGASLFVGASDISIATLFTATPDAQAARVLLVSRIPRTLALVLAGASLAVAGLLMQMLARNRFVEPSTAGTVESASLGVLVVMMFMPDVTPWTRMLIAAAFALAGTLLFFGILRRVRLRSALIVPLVGLVLGGVIESVTNFVAYQHGFMQSLRALEVADFSGVLLGRYELLWMAAALALLAYLAADRFTVAGLGREMATNVGLNFGRLLAFGLTIVALVTASVVVTAGAVPFLGLIVPNVVSLILGDNVRRALPWVALLGAVFVLLCDLTGRLVIHPYEIPTGTIAGLVGSALFLHLLLRSTRQ